MSRPASVAELKANQHFHISDKPREGTKLRRVYDLLLTGVYVDTTQFYTRGTWSAAKRQLRDFYGLEFSPSKPHQGVKCSGVWDGTYFVPIEKVLQE